MTRDELEFSISQYLDGTLAVEERSALEARLAEDAEARALLDEERRLVAFLKDADPLPQVRWEAFADRVSSSLNDVEAQFEAPAPSFRLRWAAPLALAASVLVVAGVGVRMLLSRAHSGTETVAVKPAEPVRVLEVAGPASDAPAGPVEVQIAIGPSKAASAEPILSQYSDEVISRPARVTVASGSNPAQDIPALPSDMQ